MSRMDKLLIGDFEGPLDLLLHLIKQSKMDIYNIEIVKITEEYLNFIKEMEEMNLDIASEYLVMATELIEIKSRHLLPKKEEPEEDEYEEDPEEALKKRLLEYEKYKDSTEIFRKLEEKRSNYFTKAPMRKDEYTTEKLENDGTVSVNDLLEALQKLLIRKDNSKPISTKITKKELSVKERTDKIRSILKKSKKVMFTELFEELSKPYVVVTFLSILEMAKEKEIVLKQDKNFGDIYIERVESNEL